MLSDDRVYRYRSRDVLWMRWILSGSGAYGRRAKRLGYHVTKSRQRTRVPNADNHGYYRLINTNDNWVVLGERFDARLEDIDEFLNQKSVVVVVPPLRVGA